MSTAPYADFRRAETQHVYTVAKHLEDFVPTEGWQIVKEFIARQQHARVNEMGLAPGRERADQYALRQARLAGILDGLKFAHDLPGEVLKIAKQELEQRQKAIQQMAEQETA